MPDLSHTPARHCFRRLILTGLLAAGLPLLSTAQTTGEPIPAPEPVAAPSTPAPAPVAAVTDAAWKAEAEALRAEIKSAKDETAAAKGGLTINMNIVWTLLCGFLVMLMQAGFALVETGFTRKKNAAHTMAMNFMVYAIGMLGFWCSGFALMFGGTGAATSVSTVTSLGPEVASTLNQAVGFWAGDKYFGLAGNTGYFLPASCLSGAVFTLFLFQMVFMDTTATIPTGSMAERWRFLPFCIYAFIVGAVIYPVYGAWVWGGGWLAALGKNFGLGHGHVDFAGSSVVHLCGGVLAFVGARILGPRIGKFNADGSPNPIPGHNLIMGFLGTFILAFGWFGFNAGSTLAGTDVQIGVIATNTMLASASGALFAMGVTWMKFKKPDPSFMCNGMLAGLVAITAPCAFVSSWAAVMIGAVAGVLVVISVFLVEEKLKIDDPVGAISVHGANGLWGVIALGLFANGTYGDGWNSVAGPVKGFFYGDASQLVAQVIGSLACVGAVGTMGYLMFMGIDVLARHRSDPHDEVAGLDIPEVGTVAYPEDPTSTHS